MKKIFTILFYISAISVVILTLLFILTEEILFILYALVGVIVLITFYALGPMPNYTDKINELENKDGDGI